MLTPDVSGGATAPGTALRWSLGPGTNYLHSNIDYSQGVIVNGGFNNANSAGIINSTAVVRTPDYFTKSESLYAEFGAEALYIFNRPNYGASDDNPDSPTFGGVQGKSGNRIRQLGLRLFF